MFLLSACSCLCAIYWSHVLSGEWRCSWSSAGRRCSNFIWAINNLIGYQGASYIRYLTVVLISTTHYITSWMVNTGQSRKYNAGTDPSGYHFGWSLPRGLMGTKMGPQTQGAVSIRKTVLPGVAIPMLKIRRPNGRLIFNMEIAIRR